MNRGLKWVSILTTLGMFLVLIMGSLVTKTGSGDGCGDTWPLCHGTFAPMDSIESLIEYSHRAVSGAVGLLVVWQAVWAWRKLGHLRGVKAFAFGGILFTFAQALLGAAAVVWKQSSAVLALHFGLSLTAFASVLLLTILVFDGQRMNVKNKAAVPLLLRNSIWGITSYSYAVVYLGAYVRHTNSGMGCTGWPRCNGEWIPSDFSGAIGIQFTHRLAALVFLLLMMGLFVMIYKRFRHRTDLYYGSLLALVLTVLQIASGGVVVMTTLGLLPSLLHNAIISGVFGILCFLCFQSMGANQRVEKTVHKEVANG